MMGTSNNNKNNNNNKEDLSHQHKAQLENAQVYYDKGYSFYLRNMFEEAIDEFKNALSIREGFLGRYHEDTAQTYYWIGWCYYQMSIQENETNPQGELESISLNEQQTKDNNNDNVVHYSHLALLSHRTHLRSARYASGHVSTPEMHWGWTKNLLQQIKGYTPAQIDQYDRNIIVSIELEKQGDLERENGRYSTAMAYYNLAMEEEMRSIGSDISRAYLWRKMALLSGLSDHSQPREYLQDGSRSPSSRTENMDWNMIDRIPIPNGCQSRTTTTPCDDQCPKDRNFHYLQDYAQNTHLWHRFLCRGDQYETTWKFDQAMHVYQMAKFEQDQQQELEAVLRRRPSNTVETKVEAVENRLEFIENMASVNMVKLSEQLDSISFIISHHHKTKEKAVENSMAHGKAVKHRDSDTLWVDQNKSMQRDIQAKAQQAQIETLSTQLSQMSERISRFEGTSKILRQELHQLQQYPNFTESYRPTTWYLAALVYPLNILLVVVLAVVFFVCMLTTWPRIETFLRPRVQVLLCNDTSRNDAEGHETHSKNDDNSPVDFDQSSHGSTMGETEIVLLPSTNAPQSQPPSALRIINVANNSISASQTEIDPSFDGFVQVCSNMEDSFVVIED